MLLPAHGRFCGGLPLAEEVAKEFIDDAAKGLIKVTETKQVEKFVGPLIQASKELKKTATGEVMKRMNLLVNEGHEGHFRRTSSRKEISIWLVLEQRR